MSFPVIEFPELVFAFVGASGVNLQARKDEISGYLNDKGYDVRVIKITKRFPTIKNLLKINDIKINEGEYDRIMSYIKIGNEARKITNDNSILAVLAIMQIMFERNKFRIENGPHKPVAFLVDQLKRSEEVELLRSVYGRIFFQISVYSRRSARVDYLSRAIARSEYSNDHNSYRAKAEEIIIKDEDERNDPFGQRVRKIFHDADLVVNADCAEPRSGEQLERFVNLIFGSNSISPTKMEYGMFAAKAAALRTLDLSRQVGAAVFTPKGEIITTGSNEVPKGGGGTYWCDEVNDAREYKKGLDSNDKRKREIFSQLMARMGLTPEAKRLIDDETIADTDFFDALEYGRIVHAEMSAITDAARLGRSVSNGILYCTTFPCHMCAKHIVASGISQVIFLEPYPKSLATDLHADSIKADGFDRGEYKDFEASEFIHFFGITPRRYRELFERTKRKNESGDFIHYIKEKIRPNIDLKFPFYLILEENLIGSYKGVLRSIWKKRRAEQRSGAKP